MLVLSCFCFCCRCFFVQGFPVFLLQKVSALTCFCAAAQHVMKDCVSLPVQPDAKLTLFPMSGQQEPGCFCTSMSQGQHQGRHVSIVNAVKLNAKFTQHPQECHAISDGCYHVHCYLKHNNRHFSTASTEMSSVHCTKAT